MNPDFAQVLIRRRVLKYGESEGNSGSPTILGVKPGHPKPEAISPGINGFRG
jgi:hypothetical protein